MRLSRNFRVAGVGQIEFPSISAPTLDLAGALGGAASLVPGDIGKLSAAIKLVQKKDGTSAPMVDLSHPAAAPVVTAVQNASPTNAAAQTRDAIVTSVADHAESWSAAPKVYLGPTNAAPVADAASLTLSYTPVVAFVPSFLVVTIDMGNGATLTSLVVGADPSIFSGPIPASVFAADSYQNAAYFSGGPISAAVPVTLGVTNHSGASTYVTAAIGGRRLDRLAYSSGACAGQ